MGCCYGKQNGEETTDAKKTSDEKKTDTAEKKSDEKNTTSEQKTSDEKKTTSALSDPNTSKDANKELEVDADERTADAPSPTIEHFLDQLKIVNCEEGIDYVLHAIEGILHIIENKRERPEQRSSGSTSTSRENKSLWTSVINGGAELLKFLDKHIQKSVDKGDIITDFHGTTKAVTELLQVVGKIHWVVGGLSTVAYIMHQFDQVRENRTECVELLKQMIKLYGHIRQLNYEIPQHEEKLRQATSYIIQGSMMCASQLTSKSFFRFFVASVYSDSLSTLQSRINHLYDDLTLTILREIANRLPYVLPRALPTYPTYAVGIEKKEQDILQLLDLSGSDKTPLAVVIYGIGGIGKTTLARAVISKANQNLTDFYYIEVELQENSSKNDIRNLQEQILTDLYGKQRVVRDCRDGQDQLSIVFSSNPDRPIFIYIDNVLRQDYLKDLLPENLYGLPHRSRILVTTRILSATDVLHERGLKRKESNVETLSSEDAEKILLRGTQEVRPNNLDKIVQICSGIPLVLKIVGARLRKQGWKAENCSQIIEDLEKGSKIKEENLSERLIDFVFKEFERPTQEAFLDMCCFFNNWERTHIEYILGTEVTFLEEASLVISPYENKLNVHDIIMAKGRHMSKHDRIMQLQSLPADGEKLHEIKGLWCVENEVQWVLEEHRLDFMKDSLRVLALGNKMSVSGQSQKAFRELRFLRIGGDVPCLPFDLQKLDRLAVYQGPIFIKGFSLYQLPTTLQVVKAMEQSNWNEATHSDAAVKIENSQLKELDLTGLKNLQKLPEGLFQLKSLQTLILDEWDKMVELTEQVCFLPLLSRLSIEGATSLRNLPDSFGELGTLKELNLTGCESLRGLPSTFVQLKSLEILNMKDCSKLEGLPSNFGQLTCLRKLSLRSNKMIELPETFGQLSSLRSLDLRCCTKLKRLPTSFKQLRSLVDLSLLACEELAELPSDVGAIPSLKVVDLRGCDKLKRIPSSIQQKRAEFDRSAARWTTVATFLHLI